MKTIESIEKRKASLLATVTLALGATLLFGPFAAAADETGKLDAADTRFIQEGAASGDALVKMAKLGEERGQQEGIKAFAGMLVVDHTKANAQLAALASSKGVEVAMEPAAKRSKYADMQEKLEQTSDADFDKKFLSMVVSGHEKCLRNFKAASTDASDRDVKAWAAKTLPGLQAHLEQAEKLSARPTAEAGSASTDPADAQPDNTARNTRDRDPGTLTPLDQGNSKTDIATTAQIRREIADQKALSVNAHNVKIITNDGRVTLRGPVNSIDERNLIGEIATRIATAERTDNQLEVRVATDAD
jgi:putative membrane protein